MALGQCACPECGTALRVRDRSFVGREIPCPDCQTTILITLTNSGDVVAAPAASSSSKTVNRGASVSTATNVTAPATVKNSGHTTGGHPLRPDSSGRVTLGERKRHEGFPPAADISETPSSRSPWKVWLANVASSPLTLAWLLAISLIAFLLIVALRPSVRFQPVRQQPMSEAASNAESPSSDPDKSLDSDKRNGTTDPIDQPPPPDLSESGPNVAFGATPASAIAPENVVPPSPPDSNHVAVANGNGGEPVIGQQANKTDVVPKEPAPTPVPKVDIGAALAQRIVSFKQSKPVPRRDVIELLEEMIGVPVRFDVGDLGKDRLDQSITLELENTTIEGVLRAVADAAQWQFSTEKDCIRLSRKNDGAASK